MIFYLTSGKVVTAQKVKRGFFTYKLTGEVTELTSETSSSDGEVLIYKWHIQMLQREVKQ